MKKIVNIGWEHNNDIIIKNDGNKLIIESLKQNVKLVIDIEFEPFLDSAINGIIRVVKNLKNRNIETVSKECVACVYCKFDEFKRVSGCYLNIDNKDYIENRTIDIDCDKYVENVFAYDL